MGHRAQNVQGVAELVSGSLGTKNMTSQVPLPVAERGECCARISSLSPLPTLPRAAKQRRKGDRMVISCQEQTYWLVNKPPVSPSCGESGGVSLGMRLKGSVCFTKRPFQNCFLKLWAGNFVSWLTMQR